MTTERTRVSNNSQVNKCKRSNFMSLNIDWKNIPYDELKELLEEGFDVNQRLEEKRTPLIKTVIESESIDVITLLLDSGADIASIDSIGMTALHHASHMCKTPAVQLLLSRGADFEIQDAFGWTPLARAIFLPARTDERNFEVVKLLLEYGADVNGWDKKGDSLLMNAVLKNDNANSIKAIIDRGPEINATNSNGMTPLMLAARNNQNPKIVQLLLDAGADIKMKDNNGMTAWDHIQVNTSLRETSAYRKLKSYYL